MIVKLVDTLGVRAVYAVRTSDPKEAAQALPFRNVILLSGQRLQNLNTNARLYQAVTALPSQSVEVLDVPQRRSEKATVEVALDCSEITVGIPYMLVYEGVPSESNTKRYVKISWASSGLSRYLRAHLLPSIEVSPIKIDGKYFASICGACRHLFRKVAGDCPTFNFLSSPECRLGLRTEPDNPRDMDRGESNYSPNKEHMNDN